MGRRSTPFRAVHHTTHRFDPDDKGISFPRFCNVRNKRLECDPRTPLDFPRLHGEMLAEIAGGKNAILRRTRALDPNSPRVLLFIAILAGKVTETRLSRLPRVGILNVVNFDCSHYVLLPDEFVR